MTAARRRARRPVRRALPRGQFVLKLYVTGNRPLSTRAIANIRALCERRLKGRYRLEVVDLYQQPELAKSQRILAAPTLVKTLPLPLRRMIGDLSDVDRLEWSLGLEEDKE